MYRNYCTFSYDAFAYLGSLPAMLKSIFIKIYVYIQKYIIFSPTATNALPRHAHGSRTPKNNPNSSTALPATRPLPTNRQTLTRPLPLSAAKFWSDELLWVMEVSGDVMSKCCKWSPKSPSSSWILGLLYIGCIARFATMMPCWRRIGNAVTCPLWVILWRVTLRPIVITLYDVDQISPIMWYTSFHRMHRYWMF